ncbi:MAG: anti-sigma factor, partial [Dehalococcoidia bacterium]|nr:anti-sigma factor [Dehalococcoidia bacterium]
VVVAGLPQLIPGRVYGVWLVTNDQQRVSAGRFVVDERGASLTSLTLPPINYDEWSGSFAGLAVTEVDPADPTGPSGPDLLAGPLY